LLGFLGVLALVQPILLRAQEKAKAPEPPDANPRIWQPRTKSVAVFKNGMGFFLREGEAALHDGWLVAKEIPPAAFGTLMIFSTNKDEVVDIVGSGPGEVVEFDGVDAPRDAASKRARLRTVLKMNVQLTYRHKGADQTAAGKLVSVGDDFVVLETATSNFAVHVESISRAQVLELPLRIHVSADGNKSPAKTRVGMAYLREGITWIPEYTLRVVDETTGELTLRGTLINEAEDLIHCDVNFVVGVPHFAHMKYMAPVAVGQVVRTIGAGVAPPGLSSQITSRAHIVTNANVSQQFDPVGGHGVVEKAVGEAPGKLKDAVSSLPVLESAAGSDYTVYTRKDMTVRRGERAVVTLFTKTIRYGHIYRWSPPEQMQHFLVLPNEGATAWTTGPCLAVSGDRPLTEDLLRYTPRGGKAELPVTAAINIAHEKTEAEVDRKFRAHSPSHNTFYDLVTLEGELRLKNFEKRAAKVVITTKVTGRPIDASDGGVKASDPTQLQLLQRSGTVRWAVELAPGEAKRLTYRYERYVPAN